MVDEVGDSQRLCADIQDLSVLVGNLERAFRVRFIKEARIDLGRVCLSRRLFHEQRKKEPSGFRTTIERIDLDIDGREILCDEHAWRTGQVYALSIVRVRLDPSKSNAIVLCWYSTSNTEAHVTLLRTEVPEGKAVDWVASDVLQLRFQSDDPPPAQER